MPSWEKLLSDQQDLVLPWYGSSSVHSADRRWALKGPRPPFHGWYKFRVTSRKAELIQPVVEQVPNLDWAEGNRWSVGYTVGNRFMNEFDQVGVSPVKLIDKTIRLFCAQPISQPFARVRAAFDRTGACIFLNEEFPLGPESEVFEAFLERKPSVLHIKGVTPALNLAFNVMTLERENQERRREEARRRREEEERRERALKELGSASGRRNRTLIDFNDAAAEALKVSGSELLHVSEGSRRDEKVVRFKFKGDRFECVVDSQTLGILEAGICLTDESTHVKADTWLTLESLPGVIDEAKRLGKLVVFRHV